MMRTAYVTQPGASLRRDGTRLLVFVQRKCEAELTTHDLGQLVLVGNVLLTPGAIDLLLERGIDTVMLTVHGRYRGRIVGGGSQHIILRLAQYEAMREEGRCLAVAKSIVRGKIINQRRFLLRAIREGRDSKRLRPSVLGMRATLARVNDCSTLDEVRGCEGSAAAAYFRAFGALILAEGFRFDGRNRRPPMDPVNALLSLGYTLLANVVEAAVQVVGLDPYLGALHAPEHARPSLVCDLQEEFRTPAVDTLVVAAINRGLVEPGDFEEAGEGEPVVMKRETFRMFAKAFERRMARPVLYEPLGKKLMLRAIVEQQARRFARALVEGGEYEPYSPR
ncbi:MAG: CRISPR-associated protein Cas4/endonuclease Cas1 fusion [Deltaproteobacteria bacterium ADurb.Bin207]|jgi:CRISPR-associated protein Cas1|nr:MAG: CRISPR-associated protein Cas4/endonuclease Cas1 fusion [Deltaproteobacteria bacterium ADurb.Bin207]HOE51871.1 CRISPR-associated endonuclease Cas1 [Polyangiaceae bacterium]HOR38271.1 CRISPR-associated endonuclease Cas1 [Polyangiaceae bacterium]HQF26212.1 CRISPR-associated endonuclease Cas1 [Polyangiaceae bacterium]